MSHSTQSDSNSPQSDHHAGSRVHLDQDQGHGHDEHHGDHHHGPSKEEVETENTSAVEKVEHFTKIMDYKSLNWKKLYDEPYSISYDYWWNKNSYWRAAVQACRVPLSRFRYCEDRFSRTPRNQRIFIGDNNNECRRESFEASICVTPFIWAAADIDFELGQYSSSNLIRIADLNYPSMRLASSAIQMPRDWIDAVQQCDPRGRPGQDNVPASNVIGCILTQTFPQEWFNLAQCLRLNDTTDITHQSCQLPVAALAEKWGAIQKAREVINDNFTGKVVPLELSEYSRYAEDESSDITSSADSWYQSLLSKRTRSRNDWLFDPLISAQNLPEFWNTRLGGSHDDDDDEDGAENKEQ